MTTDHPDAPRIEQSNEIAGIVSDHVREHLPDVFPTLSLRYGIADALWDAGYRLTRVEHVHAAPYSAQPGGSMDFDAIQRMVESRTATHRRRVYSEPWEPMPEGETEPADGITFTADGRL